MVEPRHLPGTNSYQILVFTHVHAFPVQYIHLSSVNIAKEADAVDGKATKSIQAPVRTFTYNHAEVMAIHSSLLQTTQKGVVACFIGTTAYNSQYLYSFWLSRNNLDLSTIREHVHAYIHTHTPMLPSRMTFDQQSCTQADQTGHSLCSVLIAKISYVAFDW